MSVWLFLFLLLLLLLKIGHNATKQANLMPLQTLEYRSLSENNPFSILLIITDIDECSADSSPCDENADCTNTDGSYSCTCKQGFDGDGQSCKGS